ncbi:hypothetical protein JXA32_12435 [Candidatus Sumerlaeota bacterium]|nr:hypothetical protein [Candidatus Sumerlaeota bacterium]
MNPTHPSQTPHHVRRMWYPFLLLALIASIFFTEIRFNLNLPESFEHLEPLQKGEGPTPFQYRILVPAILLGLENLTGETGKNLWFRWDVAITFIGMFLLVHYLRVFYQSLLFCMLMSLIGYSLLAYNLVIPQELPMLFPYDMTSLTVMLAGCLALHRKKWLLFYIVFIPGTFNKETTCFLSLYCICLYFRDIPHRKLALHVAVQIALWVAIKTFLYLHFSANAERGAFVFTLFRNLHYLCDFQVMSEFLSIFGFLGLFLLLYYNGLSHPMIKRIIWVLPVYILGMLCVGVVNENRIYLEMTPIVMAGVADLCEQAIKNSSPGAIKG